MRERGKHDESLVYSTAYQPLIGYLMPKFYSFGNTYNNLTFLL